VNAILERIEGETAVDSHSVFSTQNHVSADYDRDADFFGADLDLTGCSPWNSWDGPRGAGTLITRRHVLVSAHLGIFGTPTMRFIDQDGNVITRTVVAGKKHPLYPTDGHYPDVAVYVLDSDLPAEIKHYKILPGNLADYLSDADIQAGRPLVFGTDQVEDASVAALWKPNARHVGSTYSRVSEHQKSFFKSPVVGDSSSPYFFIINDEPVIVFVLTGNGGTKLHPLIADINQLIVDVDTLAGFSTGYTVETVDLSAFPTYE
jgi:hypothetical protein